MSVNTPVFDPLYSGWDEKYRTQTGDADAWSSQPHAFTLKAVEMLAGGKSKVADLGCGDGRNTRPFVEAGHRVTSLDLSPTALKQLLVKFQVLGLESPTTVLGQLEEIPLASDEFDLVLAADVLPQVKDVRRAMEEIHRILKPGGKCVANVLTPRDCAFGEGEQIAPRSFVYKGCLFSFFESEDMHRLFQGLFDIVSEELQTWWDPPHHPFRPYKHKHDAIVYVLQKS